MAVKHLGGSTHSHSTPAWEAGEEMSPAIHRVGEAPRRRVVRIPTKVLVHTRAVLSKHVKGIAKKADEHEHLINKITYSLGVVFFGIFCFMLGARPYDIPRLYVAFFLVATPLRWAYYKSKKWHYFLLDFCYFANAIMVVYLVFFPRNERLFLLSFAFSEGPLAWALIVWRCSLVFSSVDKIVSVLIHLLPGTVLYIIRWWDPVTFSLHSADDTGPFPAWPLVPDTSFLLLWLLIVPLLAYSLWQALYYLVVEVLRRQRLVRDPEVMTSFRELSRKAARANNVWWQISGLLGDANRFLMYCALQGLFTVATVALTILQFRSYQLHTAFQIFKAAASVWNGGNFFFDVMPRQVQAKAERRSPRVAPEETRPDHSVVSGNVGARDAGPAPKDAATAASSADFQESAAAQGLSKESRDSTVNSQGSLAGEGEDEDVWEEVDPETVW